MRIPSQNGTMGTPASPFTVTPAASGVLTYNQHASGSLTATVTGGVAPFYYMWSDESDFDSRFSAQTSLTTTVNMFETTQSQTYTFKLIVVDANNNVGSGTVDVSISYPNAPV